MDNEAVTGQRHSKQDAILTCRSCVEAFCEAASLHISFRSTSPPSASSNLPPKLEAANSNRRDIGPARIEGFATEGITTHPARLQLGAPRA